MRRSSGPTCGLTTATPRRTTFASPSEVRVSAGDAVVLIHGVHAIKVVEDFQALSVKQGPFLGDEEDKVVVETTTAS